ncbi:DnaA regulatory inactivator Hda [Candidatus Accumulibacter sp. ACC007]|uniref:DnaA regulatory inactivator Hda n=1 Tax=Candidatus Accumulibacter sp. ACC007 TaxID=2823333 RepID=UPI0025C25D51|nr:DnaA regulatory inactivator Hda [Candidatus Accumulibacter sp. ACC007]
MDHSALPDPESYPKWPSRVLIAPQTDKPEPPQMRQLILDLLPEERPSFENFVAGGNAEALTGLAAWLAPVNREPLFFLWGEAGAGKSHLLQASEAAYSDARMDPDLSEIAPDGCTHAVDNVEALSARGQISLFNLINRLCTSGGRLLAAASVPPRQLRLREDLRTRLGSSLVYRLQPLSDGEKLAALGEQARARGLLLPAEAFTYLFLRAPRDMRSLTALLMAIDRYSLEHQRPVTLSLLREVLQAPLER